MNYLWSLVICFIGVISLNVGCSTKTVSSDDLPNFIIFFVDDLGYYNLGFRNDAYYTPHIDQLKNEGAIFSNAYVPAPTCSPSRVGLLTGQHPAQLQFYRHSRGGHPEFHMHEDDPAQLPSRNWLPLDVTTYAELLKEKNYQTLFLGKWHLGRKKHGPEKQGFDEAYTHPPAGHPGDYYPPYFNSAIFEDVQEDEYLTDYLTDKAVDYLKNYKGSNPFLLQFSYYNVHTPNVGRKDFIAHYREQGFNDRLSEFGAQVSAVDASVGRVLDALEKTGQDGNTIVIFLSDQGSYFSNKPLRGHKRGGTALYEGGSKVPFIMKWPGVTKSGMEIKTHVQTTDVFPTIAEIIGKNPTKNKKLEGVSLTGLLKDAQPLKREALYAYRSYGQRYASVLTSDKWKLIAHRDGTYELYKVDEDIAEAHNLVDKYPEKVELLAAKLKKWEQEKGVWQKN